MGISYLSEITEISESTVATMERLSINTDAATSSLLSPSKSGTKVPESVSPLGLGEGDNKAMSGSGKDLSKAHSTHSSDSNTAEVAQVQQILPPVTSEDMAEFKYRTIAHYTSMESDGIAQKFTVDLELPKLGEDRVMQSAVI